ncbi:MAG: metallophosphoesterase, partial [Deltaproteobacteria bacterium]|nr:metallophosphoesterase [Deltaproteobacteria bacterium]
MTPARTVALLLTLACLHPRTAAGWPEVQYLDHPGDLTWFVAFSDTHVGASDLLYGSKDLVRLGWATTELVSVVEPAFVVNAGDLTDASGLGPIPTGQIETEWIEYAETLAAGGMDAAFYHDLPGNHDHYGDGDLSHYRTWSVSGASDDQVNHAWTFTTPATGYLALGLATCASDGQPSPFDNAGLDEVDRAFVTDTMAQHPAEPLVVVFGHHPVSALDEGRDFLEELLSQDRVGLYLYGHTHDYAVFWDLGALHVNVRSLTKNDNLHVALVALDGRGLSLRVFDEGDWPQVLITAPLDRDLGGGNATAAPIPWHLTAAPLRALAFDPSGVAAVEWNVDGSPWSPMGEAGEHIWQGTFDASVLSE